VSRLVQVVEALKPYGRQARKALAIVFDGYNDTAQLACEIPAIRSWCQKAIRRVPHLFYYLESDFGGTDGVVAAAISDYKATMPLELRRPPDQLTDEELVREEVHLEIFMPDKLGRRIATSTYQYGRALGETDSSLLALLSGIPGLPSMPFPPD